MGRGGRGIVLLCVSGARTRQYTGKGEGEVAFFCIMEPRIGVAEVIVCNLNHYSEERKMSMQICKSCLEMGKITIMDQFVIKKKLKSGDTICISA